MARSVAIAAFSRTLVVVHVEAKLCNGSFETHVTRNGQPHRTFGVEIAVTRTTLA